MCLCINRLRAETTLNELEKLARRARKLQGDRLGLEDFAHFLNLRVTDLLTQIHRLFDQVNPLIRCFCDRHTHRRRQSDYKFMEYE